MKTNLKSNNILLIILDTDSDTILFPNHQLLVELGWKYMLDELQFDSKNLTTEEKEKVMEARSLINKYKQSIDKKTILDQFNEKYHFSLSHLPQDPKGLIRQSLSIVTEINDEEVDKANILYLNGFIKNLNDSKSPKISELANKLSTLDQRYTILRAPHKREIIPTDLSFELMNYENTNILNFKNVINFGILEDGSRRDNLQDIISDHQECIVVISPKELERINNILIKPEENQEINRKIIAKIKGKKICTIGECNFTDFPKITEHFSECFSFNPEDFRSYLDDSRSTTKMVVSPVISREQRPRNP